MELRGVAPPSQELSASVLRCCMHRPANLSDRMSDILYEHERRSPLSILKSPPKQPKAVTVQARVEESVKTQLELYAEFIDASTSYRNYRGPEAAVPQRTTTSDAGQTNTANHHNNEKVRGEVLQRPSNKHEVPSNPIGVRGEHSVPKTACPALCSRRLVRNTAPIVEESLETQPSSPRNARSMNGSRNPLHAPSQDGVTGRDSGDERHLLNVHEVAELLQVTRVLGLRTHAKMFPGSGLPGYRLGKYWRFRKNEVLAWVDCHSGGSHAA